MFSSEKLAARIAGVILAPRKTLPTLSREPGSWVPVIIVAVLLMISRWILLPELLATYNSDEFVAKYAQRLNLTEVEAMREVKIMRTAAPIIALVETPFILFSGVVIVGFIIFTVGKLRYKSNIGYKPFYRVVAWSSIISGIPLALSIPLKLINPHWSFPSNLSYLLPNALKSTYFFQIFQTLDFFLIWEVWLISLGFATLCNISLQRSVRTIGTIFIIFIVLNALALTQ